jgi:hypothetical protein
MVETATNEGRYSVSTAKQLIYQLTQRGFTSELNQLLSARLYCLDQRIEFRLSSRYWGATVDQGWCDYFEPFCQEKNNRLTRIGTITSLPQRIARRQKIYKGIFRSTLFTHDVWQAMQDSAFIEKDFYIPQMGIEGDIFHAKQILLQQMYRFNAETTTALKAATAGIQKPFIGLHIRRGDKLVSEAKLVELDQYVAAMQETMPQLTRVFIATDDYAVVKEFKERHPQYEIETLCQQTQKGYQQSSHNQASSAAKRAVIHGILADIECLCRAEHFIGTFSSNIGRLIALRLGLEKCTSLDDEWHAR